MEECVEECARFDGCFSVTYQPHTSNCWLKKEVFHEDSPGFREMEGVVSRNLKCPGYYPVLI